LPGGDATSHRDDDPGVRGRRHAFRSLSLRVICPIRSFLEIGRKSPHVQGKLSPCGIPASWRGLAHHQSPIAGSAPVSDGGWRLILHLHASSYRYVAHSPLRFLPVGLLSGVACSELAQGAFNQYSLEKSARGWRLGPEGCEFVRSELRAWRPDWRGIPAQTFAQPPPIGFMGRGFSGEEIDFLNFR
jgi:hypothetical protein